MHSGSWRCIHSTCRYEGTELLIITISFTSCWLLEILNSFSSFFWSKSFIKSMLSWMSSIRSLICATSTFSSSTSSRYKPSYKHEIVIRLLLWTNQWRLLTAGGQYGSVRAAGSVFAKTFSSGSNNNNQNSACTFFYIHVRLVRLLDLGFCERCFWMSLLIPSRLISCNTASWKFLVTRAAVA